jgi:hypothetical protein
MLVLACICAPFAPGQALALQSNSYRFDESVIGVGGMGEASSTNYKAVEDVGALAVGNSASSNFQVEAGTKTTHDPTLSFKINTSNLDLGNFTASGPTTTSASFTVSNYTSYGYVVQLMGTPPKNGSHTIDPLTTSSTSQPGVDQFGVNLVANTAPLIGSNPDNGQFGFGSAAPNYATPNKYRFVNGETIAKAEKSSGDTNYTLSYLVNVESLTPGGKYTSNQTLVVTGTY